MNLDYFETDPQACRNSATGGYRSNGRHDMHYRSVLMHFYPPYVSMEGYISCCFFSVRGYRYLGVGGTDRREILHDSTYRSRTDILPFGAGTFGIPKSEIVGLNFDHLTATMSKTASHSVTCQLELNISSSRAF